MSIEFMFWSFWIETTIEYWNNNEWSQKIETWAKLIRNWNNNSIWELKIETSQYSDERKWNNKENFGYKLDQAYGIIMHAHDDVFLTF